MASQTAKILTVPPNGQISIGKRWAGQEVKIEQISETEIRISAGTFIPAKNSTFYTAGAKKNLEKFEQWEKANPPRRTDIRELRSRLAKKKA